MPQLPRYSITVTLLEFRFFLFVNKFGSPKLIRNSMFSTGRITLFIVFFRWSGFLANSFASMFYKPANLRNIAIDNEFTSFLLSRFPYRGNFSFLHLSNIPTWFHRDAVNIFIGPGNHSNYFDMLNRLLACTTHHFHGGLVFYVCCCLLVAGALSINVEGI